MSYLQSPGFDGADFAAQRAKLVAAYDNIRADSEQRAFAMSENVRTAFASLDVEPWWYERFTYARNADSMVAYATHLKYRRSNTIVHSNFLSL
jgi:hypothetical protein